MSLPTNLTDKAADQGRYERSYCSRFSKLCKNLALVHFIANLENSVIAGLLDVRSQVASYLKNYFTNVLANFVLPSVQSARVTPTYVCMPEMRVIRSSPKP